MSSLQESLTQINVSNTIHDLVNQFSSIRKISQKMEVKTNIIEILQTNENFQAGWVSYNENREETSIPKIKKLKIHCHELYAQPMIAQQVIDDSIISIENWISNNIYKSFIEKEEIGFLFGSKENEPEGIALSMNAENTVESEITYESLIKLMNIIPDNLFKNTKFMMHRETLYEIQKIQDVNNKNIYQSAISDKIPESLFGIEVIINNHMPSVSQYKNDKPLIILGNFYSGYLIIDRSEIDIIHDPYTEKPFVKFYAVKRVGGAVVNSKSFAFLKLKTE